MAFPLVHNPYRTRRCWVLLGMIGIGVAMLVTVAHAAARAVLVALGFCFAPCDRRVARMP